MHCVQESEDPLMDPFGTTSDPFANMAAESSSDDEPEAKRRPAASFQPSLNLTVYKIPAYEKESKNEKPSEPTHQGSYSSPRIYDLNPIRYKKNGEVAKKRGPPKGYKRKPKETSIPPYINSALTITPVPSKPIPSLIKLPESLTITPHSLSNPPRHHSPKSSLLNHPKTSFPIHPSAIRNHSPKISSNGSTIFPNPSQNTSTNNSKMFPNHSQNTPTNDSTIFPNPSQKFPNHSTKTMHAHQQNIPNKHIPIQNPIKSAPLNFSPAFPIPIAPPKIPGMPKIPIPTVQEMAAMTQALNNPALSGLSLVQRNAILSGLLMRGAMKMAGGNFDVQELLRQLGVPSFSLPLSLSITPESQPKPVIPKGVEHVVLELDPGDWFPEEPYRMSFSRKKNPKWKTFPHQCEHCFKGYRVASSLVAHAGERHGAVPRSLAVPCPCCPHVSVRRKQHRRHLAAHAVRRGKLYCVYCIPPQAPGEEYAPETQRFPIDAYPQYYYASEESLRLHRKRKHPYAALLCVNWFYGWMDNS